MELKIDPRRGKLIAGLGISDERAEKLLNLSTDWLKNELRKATTDIDKLDFIKQCAAISENLEEYTFLAINVEHIIENTSKEVHEETCPSCKARKEAEERRSRESINRRASRAFGGVPGTIEQIAPGMFAINL